MFQISQTFQPATEVFLYVMYAHMKRAACMSKRPVCLLMAALHIPQEVSGWITHDDWYDMFLWFFGLYSSVLVWWWGVTLPPKICLADVTVAANQLQNQQQSLPGLAWWSRVVVQFALLLLWKQTVSCQTCDVIHTWEIQPQHVAFSWTNGQWRSPTSSSWSYLDEQSSFVNSRAWIPA